MNKKNTEIPLKLNSIELVMIQNALNEVCNGISFSDEEFHARLGYDRLHYLKLLERIANHNQSED